MATESGALPSARKGPSSHRRLLAWLGEPMDPSSLGAYRALLGGLMFCAVVRFWAYGWIDELYVAPDYHFTYQGFDWVEVWPGLGMYAHFALLGLSALCLCLGLAARVAALSFCVAFTYVELLDKATYLNHYYLVSLMSLLLAVLPSGAAHSLDARRRARRGQPSPGVCRYHYVLLRGQIGLVYLFAGIAKLNADWLLRAEPLATWLSARADVPLVGSLLAASGTAHVMSVLGAVYDCTLPILLLMRRTRRLAFAWGVAFHVVVWLLFPIGVFSWVMIASTTLFFEPSWPRAVLSRLRRRRDSGEPRWLPALPELSHARAVPPRPARLRGAVAASTAYLLVQALVPLRFLAYPGHVNWHEQGFRFAWRVMLIEKTGKVDFDVVADGQKFKVYPRDLLTPLQYRMMSTQPDMIQQFALHLKQEFARRGHERIGVYANAWASLNGHPTQRLIDPETDLASTRPSFAPARWIVPFGQATAQSEATRPEAATAQLRDPEARRAGH